MKILCIGEALIDMICTDTGSKLSEGLHFQKKAGGAPTNVAAAIGALGGTVSLAACVGRDPFGQYLTDTMASFRVDTQWLKQDPDHFTTIAFVSLMESGERDFYFNRGADGFLGREDVAEIDLSSFAIVHFGSATAFLPGPLQETYVELLQKARDQHCFISFDPNYRHLLYHDRIPSFCDQSWHFLQACNFFKVSDEEALMLTGKTDPDAAARTFLEKTSAVFAITLGKEGTLLGINGRLHQVGSIPVKSIDSTGAGDAFVGALLYQLSIRQEDQMGTASEEEWKSMVLNSNRAGARTCEYLGAMEAFRHLSADIFR